MEFIPFKAPPSDHHPLQLGLSSENGVTPKGLVEGVNAYFTHVFSVLKGDIVHLADAVDADARAHLGELGDAITALQQQVEMLVANSHLTANAAAVMPTLQAQVAQLTAQVSAIPTGGAVKVDPVPGAAAQGVVGAITVGQSNAAPAPAPGTTEHDQLQAALAKIAALQAETTASTTTAPAAKT